LSGSVGVAPEPSASGFDPVFREIDLAEAARKLVAAGVTILQIYPSACGDGADACAELFRKLAVVEDRM
jgi:hypothetical protein